MSQDLGFLSLALRMELWGHRERCGGITTVGLAIGEVEGISFFFFKNFSLEYVCFPMLY